MLIWLCQKYIDKILNEFNIGTTRKVLVAQKGLKEFNVDDIFKCIGTW